MKAALYRLENILQRYDQRDVLQIPKLEIEAGEIFCVVGPSGAGKSTLLRLLALLESPHRGSLILNLNGRDILAADASLDERRRLTMVFQKPLLLSRSVQENVAYGRKLRGDRDSKTSIIEALRRVHLLDRAASHASTLSGGEIQRVALARALVLEPQILLLDEPTANLDPANVSLIEDLIREQRKTHWTTIVLVTHNLFQAQRLATRVGLLIQGELVEVAPVDDFFDRPQNPMTEAFISGKLVY